MDLDLILASDQNQALSDWTQTSQGISAECRVLLNLRRRAEIIGLSIRLESSLAIEAGTNDKKWEREQRDTMTQQRIMKQPLHLVVVKHTFSML